METQSNIQQEIEAKAIEKKLFTQFDNESLDRYFSLAITMKISTDNLKEGQQRQEKDLAILYKRFSFNSSDLLSHIQKEYTNSCPARSKKVEMLRREIGDADRSYNELIKNLTIGSQISFKKQETDIVNSKNAFSYQFNPSSQKAIPSSTQSQNNSSNIYPVIGAGFLAGGAIATTSSLGSSIAGSTATSLSSSLAYPTLNNFNAMPSQITRNIAQPNAYSFNAPQANTNFNQFNNTMPAQQNQYQTSYSQNYQNPGPNYQQSQFNMSQQQPMNTSQQMSNQYQNPAYNTQQSRNMGQYQNNPMYNSQQYQQQQPLTIAPNSQQNLQQQPQQQPITTNPNSMTFGPITLRNQNSKGQLRTIYCTYEIIEAFIAIASANTNRKLETCAILAGSERNDCLIIDTLIIPTQEGHTDHCFMTDEMQLFETQIKHKVMTLGWIHTHPQYSLFLSSVDVHNQMGYQLQMPEAVAIVYSPIESARYKTFRVKDSRISEIQKCKQQGFHEHKDQNGQQAFEECQHIKYIRGNEHNVKVQTLDLR